MEKCLQDGIDDIFPENFQVYKCPIFVGSYYWLLHNPAKNDRVVFRLGISSRNGEPVHGM
jgi:hypothetical protein